MSKYIAVGYAATNGTTTSYSADGTNWIVPSFDGYVDPFTPPNGTGYAIAWNSDDNYWLAGGYTDVSGNTTIVKSYDGLNWTRVINDPFAQVVALSLAWNGTYWIAGGLSGSPRVTIAKSTDGMNWTNIQQIFGSIVYDVVWNGNYWIIVGYGINNTDINVALSTDGENWILSNDTNENIAGRDFNSVAWNNDDERWMIVGGSSGASYAFTSPDGQTWTQRADPFGTSISTAKNQANGIVWNGTYWVCVGSDTDGTNTIAYSTNGQTWHYANSNPFGTDGYGYSIMWDGTYLLAGGNTFNLSTNSIVISNDGINWTPANLDPFSGSGCNCIAWNGIQQSGNACFAEGTLIKTNLGYKAVEKLKATDLLVTSNEKIIKIKKIVSFYKTNNLYVIKKDTIEPNVPFKDTYMTGDHAFNVNNEWFHMNHSKYSEKVETNKETRYYHIEIQDWYNNLLLANGLPVEAYLNKKEIVWNCSNDKISPCNYSFDKSKIKKYNIYKKYGLLKK